MTVERHPLLLQMGLESKRSISEAECSPDWQIGPDRMDPRDCSIAEKLKDSISSRFCRSSCVMPCPLTCSVLPVHVLLSTVDSCSSIKSKDSLRSWTGWVIQSHPDG